MRLYLYFNREIMFLNLPISLMGSLLLQTVNISLFTRGEGDWAAGIRSFITGTMVLFITIGFLLALLLYFRFNRHEIPLFYNKNISIKLCIAAAYGIHCIVSCVILAVLEFSLNRMGCVK